MILVFYKNELPGPPKKPPKYSIAKQCNFRMRNPEKKKKKERERGRERKNLFVALQPRPLAQTFLQATDPLTDTAPGALLFLKYPKL